ncbi:hypothetical protein HDU90_007210 [Geranomyces variabilis]|nr:hypothetical protein HDU90_007210 [Geranomyces variabilis]
MAGGADVPPSPDANRALRFMIKLGTASLFIEDVVGMRPWRTRVRFHGEASDMPLAKIMQQAQSYGSRAHASPPRSFTCMDAALYDACTANVRRHARYTHAMLLMASRAIDALDAYGIDKAALNAWLMAHYPHVGTLP